MNAEAQPHKQHLFVFFPFSQFALLLIFWELPRFFWRLYHLFQVRSDQFAQEMDYIIKLFSLLLTHIPGRVCLIIHQYPLLEMQFAGAQCGAGMGAGIPARSPWNGVFEEAHTISLGGRRHRLMCCILNNFGKSFKSTLCFSQQGRFDL